MLNRSSIFTLKRSKVGLPKPIILRKNSGFDIRKQEMNIPIGDSEIIDEEPEEILCMICLDRISENVIEEHRKICSNKSKQELFSDSALKKNTEKIRKILDFLRANKQSGDPRRIKQYIQFCKKILKHPDSYVEIKETMGKIDNDLKKSQGIPKIRVYLERVFSLTKDHVKILQKLNIEERSRKKEALKSGIRQLERKKNKALDTPSPLNIDLQKIEEIQSQVTSKYCSSYRNSDLSCLNTPRSEKNSIRDDDNSTADGDFRQYFFSLCINSKMQFPTSDPAQTVPINALYNKAQDNFIPPELWSQFVLDELRNPKNWVHRSSRVRRSSFRPRRSGIIECIPEED